MKKIYAIWFVLMLFIVSCEKEQGYEDFQSETLIRQIGNSEEDMRIITYYNTGHVFEDLNRYSYRKFTYNNENKLAKIEVAQSLNPLSCAIIPGASYQDGDDPRKAKFGQRYDFEYDENGLLKTKKQFLLNNDAIQLMTYSSYEYAEGKVIKMNAYNPMGELLYYYTYAYDEKGNVAREEYYIVQQENTEILHHKYLFAYDDKLNPFRVFDKEGLPGINSNANNIAEQTNIYYYDGEQNSSTISNTYEYNELEYPVMANNINYTYGKEN